MAIMDYIDIPTGVDDVVDNLMRSAPEMMFLTAGLIFGAVFLGPLGATLLGFAGLSYGYREEEGNWPWEEVM
jgi:hypothetical protein